MTIVETEYNASIDKLRKSGIKLVDKSEWAYRMDNCKKCINYQPYSENQEMFRCLKCGCAGFKFMIKSFKCPLTKPKWK
jgi:hypothetical protein|tara:strand:- start:2503 stop:2739 length:237 start_codon:yes stop_codon:yes gene_type:complete